jgi:hypothetical protein
MPIWKLSPITSSAFDNAWACTNWFGSILVRAKNPRQARKFAAEAFRKAQEGETDADSTALMSPWLDDKLVICSGVPVSTYRPDGPDQILQPHLIEYNRT